MTIKPDAVSCNTIKLALTTPICSRFPYAPDQTYAKASPKAKIIANNFCEA